MVACVPRTSGPIALRAALLTVVLVSCRGGFELVAHGELPAGTQTAVVALEQGEARLLYAQALSDGPLSIDVPESFDDGAPIVVTRIALRETLMELGRPRSGLLPESPPRPRPLSSLTSLVIENAALLPGSDLPVRFASGSASEWVRDHPVSRPDLCIKSVRVEFARMGTGPRDVLAVSRELAVGVFIHEILTFRADGAVEVHALPSSESGRAAGLGVGDRIWVVTSSRAAVLDPVSGVLSESVPVPEGTNPVGVGEDPATGELYLLSDVAEVWRRSAGGETFERFFTVPPERVRPGLENKAGRFLFLGPRRFLAFADDVAVLLEVDGDIVRLLTGAAVGLGFPVGVRTSEGRIFLVEAARGELFEYVPGRLELRAKLPTRLAGLEILSEAGPRLVYLGISGVLGTVDLGLPEECPDTLAGTLVGPDGTARVGDRLLVRGEIHRGQYGFAWVELEP